MKIISIRKGFAADHSSTSYEFLAVDKPLDQKARAEVASLSRRTNPTRRRVSFVYNAEGYDIPSGWEPLMRDHYDVMYSESYDWWTLAMAFPATKEQQEALGEYEFDGEDDLGIRVIWHEDRVIVSVFCRLDPGAMVFHKHHKDYIDETDEEEAQEEGMRYESEDPMLDLLIQVRAQLMAGDYRCLYAVWDEYGCEEEEIEQDEDEEPWTAPPAPPDKPGGRGVAQQFRSMLAEP